VGGTRIPEKERSNQKDSKKRLQKCIFCVLLRGEGYGDTEIQDSESDGFEKKKKKKKTRLKILTIT
jgi:hypothetical protein